MTDLGCTRDDLSTKVVGGAEVLQQYRRGAHISLHTSLVALK
jgi:chemotaxis receptor (MCP) glutamine deamidase CheD